MSSGSGPYGRDDISDLEEIAVAESGKRCGVQHTPWMGDWFTSWSPRNGNSHAEGPWDHWVDVALLILADPMTKIVRPEVHLDNPPTHHFNAECNRALTDNELAQRFGPPVGGPAVKP